MDKHIHWEERITDEQSRNISGALEEGQRGDALYDTLTANGVTSEEASEIADLYEEANEQGDY